MMDTLTFRLPDLAASLYMWPLLASFSFSGLHWGHFTSITHLKGKVSCWAALEYPGAHHRVCPVAWWDCCLQQLYLLGVYFASPKEELRSCLKTLLSRALLCEWFERCAVNWVLTVEISFFFSYIVGTYLGSSLNLEPYQTKVLINILVLLLKLPSL